MQGRRHYPEPDWLSHALCKMAAGTPCHVSPNSNLKMGFDCARPIQPLQCAKCAFETPLFWGYKIHVASRCSRTPKPSIYRCKKCNFRSCSKFVIIQHKCSSKHYQCPDCPSQFRSKKHLWYHKWVHSSPSNDHWLKCNSCSYTTTDRTSLRNHKLVKHTEDVCWHKCETRNCKFKTKRADSLKRHVLMKHSDDEVQWFQCGSCSYETKWKENLQRHRKQHNLKFFYCKLCPFRASFRARLVKHVQVKH